MKDKTKLLDYVLQFIQNGDVKVSIQNGKVVKVSYRINDKENVLTLENILTKTG